MISETDKQLKNPEPRLKLLNEAKESLKFQRMGAELCLAKYVIGVQVEELKEALEYLDKLDKADERLNTAIQTTERLIQLEKLDKMKPGDCIKNICNGGDCKNTWHMNCDDCFEPKDGV